MTTGKDERGSALIVVRNPCTHDSRVLREAATLKRLGWRPSILAVVSENVTARRARVGGVPILRLAPTSPLAWIRSRLRRRRGGTGDRAASAAGWRPGGDARSPSWLRRLHGWLRTLDYYRRAITVVRRERPALLHCNDYNTMWIGVAARLLGRTAVVYDAHELWPDRNLRPEPRWWLLASEALFVRVAHRTLTASPGYAEVMARRYRISPPTVVRNIPAPASLSASVTYREPAEDGAVTYVGSLTRNRGLEIGIAALAHVPDAHLRLVGPARDGYEAELTELARREGVLERLELAGPVAPDQVVEAIGGAGVGLALIQPTCLSYELSLPNKLFEYMLAGVPVLGSDLPVIGEFIRRHQLGLVANPADVTDVAAKLRELLEPERNRALRKAVRGAATELVWDRESSLLTDAYRDALARARPSMGWR